MATPHRPDATLTYDVLGRWLERYRQCGGSSFSRDRRASTADNSHALDVWPHELVGDRR